MYISITLGKERVLLAVKILKTSFKEIIFVARFSTFFYSRTP